MGVPNDPAGSYDPSSAGPPSSTTGSIAKWPVYWGVAQAGQDQSDRLSGETLVPMTVAGAYLAWNDPKEFSDLDKRNLAISLYRAGLISNPGNYDQVQAAWQQAVQDAAQAFNGGNGQKITPLQMLAAKIKFSSDIYGGDKKGPGGIGGVGTTSTGTTTSYSIPSPQDAEAVVKSVYQQGLGRDPTENELAKYSAIIAGIAKKNPSTSSSTSSTDAQGNTRTTTSTHDKSVGAAGMQQAIMDQVQADPEYGAYQAATTYYNAALKAIASPV